jgi:acetyltransferase
MSLLYLDKIFQPRSIAVVGASERPATVGSAIMRNLIEEGFSGSIYPVNPKHRQLWNRKAFVSLTDLDGQADLAVVAAPIAAVPEIMQDCIAAGIHAAVIISAGGKETGPKGAAIEARIKEVVKGSDIRIIGPNCLGVINTGNRLNASFASGMPIAGRLAFVSQSGAICTSISDYALKERIGFSHVISLGSMLDVDFGDIIDYLGTDPSVGSIVMYIESLSRIRNFMSAARAVSRIKPIIALKAGRTRAGARAAASHTGALAGEDTVYDAAFMRAGIVRVKTFEELFDCAEFIAKLPKPTGPGLAIVTNAGGPGVMAADALSDYGVEPATLSAGTIARLSEFLPPHWSHGNPVDMIGDSTLLTYSRVVDILLEAKEVNGLLIMLAPQGIIDPTALAECLAERLKGKSLPVFTAWLGGLSVEKGREILNRAGLTTFDSPERAVRAFMDLWRYSKNQTMLQETPSRLPERLTFDRGAARRLIDTALGRENGLMTEAEAKALLCAYGIPVNPTVLARDTAQAVAAARQSGYPVVLKICSHQISHKSEVSGVVLDLATENEVETAFSQIMDNARRAAPQAIVEGVTVQPMVRGGGYELILGAKKDKDFGPVILFGMGGIMTEVLRDRAIALPPLNRLLSRRLMEETKVFRILKGFRNRAPANMALLEEILIRLSQLVIDFAEIEELDINPLMAVDDLAMAVDARVVVKPAPVPAPLHLTISPYPQELESRIQLAEVGELFIRPIRPEDAQLLLELFDSLSAQSVYFRFFSPIKRLPHSMLARFTQIDYDREIALVALRESGGVEKMLGVARIIEQPRQRQAEFAVVVADRWHGKGIGAQLLKRCLSIAKERHLEKITGTVLSENTQMLALGRKLNFTVKRVPEADQYELTIDLGRSD